MKRPRKREFNEDKQGDELAILLTEFRIKKEWEQLELANTIKVHRSSIANWEAGTFKPKRDMLIRIAKVLELSQHDTDALLKAAQYDCSKGLERIPDRVRKAYLEAIDKRYGFVSLPIDISVHSIFQPLQLRQDPLAAEKLPREERRLLLDETVYEKSSQWQRLSDPEDHLSSNKLRQTALVVTARNGNDALSKSPQKRMVVLGGPGTGKSTLLQYFVSDRARKALSDPTAPIPIFIRLAEFARSGQSFQKYLSHIAQKLQVEEQYGNMLWAAIDEGEAFICLDGLDEVVDQREDMIKDIKLFISTSNEKTIWVIGSRFTNYQEQELISESFTMWELQPLDDTLRQELANCLFPEIQRLFPKESKMHPSQSTTLIKTLKDHPKIGTWGKNPLLFTLAAVAFVQEGKLPVDRSDLYRTNIETLLKLHEQNHLNQYMLYRQLSALALELFLERKGRIFTLDDLISLKEESNRLSKTWNTLEFVEFITKSTLLEIVSKETYGFLHQNFQEFLAADYLFKEIDLLIEAVKKDVKKIVDVEAEAKLNELNAFKDVDVLIAKANEPSYRQVIIELAHIAHQKSHLLEKILYQRLITFWGQIKIMMTKDHDITPVSTGVSNIFEELFDLWGGKLCATLKEGSADRTEDGEVASSIGYILEQNPKDFATPALIESMYKYKKKVRFIEALGNIGTEEAIEALLNFLGEAIKQPEDLFLFRPLAEALGKNHAEEASFLFQTLLNENMDNEKIKIVAQRAFRTLSQAEIYDLEEVREALTVTDKEGRRSDWKRIQKIARWLQYSGLQDETIREHLPEVIVALETVLRGHHEIDYAREAVAAALGELGNSQTFALLLQLLEKEDEIYLEAASAMLSSLRDLVNRGQVDPLFEKKSGESFKVIREIYPQLEHKVRGVEDQVQQYFERKASSGEK